MRPLQAETETPLVSVVMSVFNGQQFLLEAIESILRQSYRNFEFVIVDDGSTDSSPELLKAYAASDPRIVLHRKEHSGLIDSLNAGCERARGAYIARMDADDIATSDRLASQVAFMEQHPEVGVVGSDIIVMSSTGQEFGVERYPREDHEIKAALLRGDMPLAHPTTFIRKTSLRAVGGYRKALIDSEDADLWLRIADSWQLANLATPILRYRRHPGQISVRKFKQGALSGLAARAATEARRAGRPDPLDSVDEITPEVFAQLGVSEQRQSEALARAYLVCAASMCEAQEYAFARELLSEFAQQEQFNDVPHIAADALLLGARIDRAEGRPGAGALSICRAIVTRPAILARPLKPLLRRLQLMRTMWQGASNKSASKV